MFHLMFVHYTFYWLLSGHLLGNSCAPVYHLYLLYFVYLYFIHFPFLVLRASAITMPELLEINLVSGDDNSFTDRN